MRTNIEIDESLLRQAMAVSGSVTKKATVEAALELTVGLKEQEEVRGLFGKVQWDGDLDQMRQSRVLDWEADQEPSGKTGGDGVRGGDEQRPALTSSNART